MEVVTQHLQEYWKLYLAGVVIGAPIIIGFRRWSIPLIQYAVELVIYLGLIHVFVGGLVRAAAWFKDKSTLSRARGLTERDFNPGWTTPIPRFWEYQEYNPRWLLYLEIALAIGIVILIWEYRPLRVQRRKRKLSPPTKEKSQHIFKKTGGHR